VRVESKWTPGTVILWLIAAVVATFIVCSQSLPKLGPPADSTEVDFELKVVE
jgi:hypothetical protein